MIVESISFFIELNTVQILTQQQVSLNIAPRYRIAEAMGNFCFFGKMNDAS